MAFKVKRVHREHLKSVAMANGISERLADDIIHAYIKDLQDSLMDGEDVSVPGLFSIKHKRCDDGTIALRGAVSVTIKRDVKEAR